MKPTWVSVNNDMEFRTWFFENSKGPTVYVDLDFTLARRNAGTPTARPGAAEFLKSLKSLAPVVILTHADTESSTEIAKKLGFDVPVVGSDQYDRVEKSPGSVLIDDHHGNFDNTKLKLRTIGIGPERLVHVTRWDGGKDDKALSEVLPKVKNLLGVTEAVEYSGKSRTQTFKTYRQAREMAESRVGEFKSLLKKASGGHEVLADVKSKESFDNKTKDRGKKPEEVFDVLRGAILVKTKSQIRPTVERIKEFFEVKKIDFKDKPEPPFGYYGAAHVDVVVDDMICEIQVMTRKLWDYKNLSHGIYSKFRDQDHIPGKVLGICKDAHKSGNS